jgi:putative transposase
MSVYRDLFKAHIDEALLNNIRESVNKGLALGNDKFKDEVEVLTGRRVIPGKRGPKKRIARDEADEHVQKFLL